jgi:uncharacterized membrane protein YfcA
VTVLQIQRVSLWIGIVLVLTTGLIHVIGAKHSFREAAYLGWLFCANGTGSLIAAYGIYQKHRWGWSLGLLITKLSFICYVMSRTIGLPFLPAQPHAWLYPLGVASLIAEGLFMAVFYLDRYNDGV